MKKISKILLCLLIIIALSFSLVGCGNKGYVEEVVDTVIENGITYSIIKKIDTEGNTIGHYAKVIDYNGEENVVIPGTIEKTIENGTEIPVTIIAGLSFYKKEIKDVVIGENIEIIEPFAFGYSTVIGISIPSTITNIGDYAFISCLELKSVTILAPQRPLIGPYTFKFYDKNSKSKDYEIRSDLRIKVPSIAAYTTTDVLDNWSIYQEQLEEV